MPRPAALPRWAGDAANPSVPSANVTEPPEQKKDTGWVGHEIIAKGHINWLFQKVYAWLQWLSIGIDHDDAYIYNPDDLPSFWIRKHAGGGTPVFLTASAAVPEHKSGWAIGASADDEIRVFYDLTPEVWSGDNDHPTPAVEADRIEMKIGRPTNASGWTLQLIEFDPASITGATALATITLSGGSGATTTHPATTTASADFGPTVLDFASKRYALVLTMDPNGGNLAQHAAVDVGVRITKSAVE